MKSIHLGQRLKEAMNKSGLSRKEIAGKAGISEPNLYKLVKKDDIKTKTLLKLAEVLNVPLDYFIEFRASQEVKALEVQLEHEITERKFLQAQVQLYDQQFGMLIGMLKDFEASSGGEEADFLTMITPHEKKKIPLSRFIDIFYNMMITANDPKKEGWHLKYSNEFLNIVEVRKSVLKSIHLYPQEIREILSEVTPENSEEDYIDLQKIWDK